MAQPLDDAIEKLQQFCGLLTETSERVQESLSTLEAQAEGAQQLIQSVEDDLGGLGDEITEFGRQLERAQDEAVEEIEKVAEAAHDHADTRLSAAEDRLEASEETFERQLQEDRGELEKGFAELVADGFDPLAATLDTAEAEATRLDQESAQDFEDFGTAVDAHRVDADGMRTETVDGLQETEDHAETAAQELEADGGAFVAEWGDLTEELETQCADSGEGLADAYESWSGGVEDEEGEVKQGLETTAGEAAQFIGYEQGQPLAQAVGEEARSLEALAQALEETLTMLAGGEQTTDELGTLVQPLEIAGRKVEEIDSLLNELGQ